MYVHRNTLKNHTHPSNFTIRTFPDVAFRIAATLKILPNTRPDQTTAQQYYAIMAAHLHHVIIELRNGVLTVHKLYWEP